MHIALALWIATVSTVCEKTGGPPPAPRPEPPRVNFATDIQPVLAQRCQPCHFPGGVMHARLPFDDPKTIVKLGTKLFGRIKDEKTRQAIRDFVAQQRR